MTIKFEEAVSFVKTVNIDEKVIDRLVEMLVTSMEGHEMLCSQQIAESVWALIVNSVKTGKTPTEVEEMLGECENCQKIVTSYEKYQDRLIAQFKTIKWDYDEVVGFDWKVAKNHKTTIFTSEPSRSTGPALTTLSLKTLGAGKTKVEEMNITMDEPQLADLLWKLKEAQNLASEMKTL